MSIRVGDFKVVSSKSITLLRFSLVLPKYIADILLLYEFNNIFKMKENDYSGE